MKGVGMARVAWLVGFVAAAAIWVGTGTATALFAAALMLGFPLLSLAFNLFVRKKVTVSVALPSAAPKDGMAKGTLQIKNDALLPVIRAGFRLMVTNELTGEEERVVLYAGAAAKGEGETAFAIRARFCGRVRIWVEKAWCTDPLGLISLGFKPAVEGNFTSLPHGFVPEIVLSVSSQRSEECEAYAPDRRGPDPSEIYQLRDYTPGDSLKQIHWKLTGKLDRAVVREASLPISRSLLVFWDKSAAQVSPEEMDAMAEVTVSICQALSEQGQPYTLGWDDAEQERCMLEPIDTTERFLEMMPRLLRAGPSKEISGAGRFLIEKGPAAFSRVLYIAAGCPAETAELLQGTSATGLLCMAGNADFSGCVIAFGPQDYKKTLQILELDS